MFALLGLVFPFIKAFLGDGIIEKFLNHKKELAASANERERMNIEADVKVLSYELQRREVIRDLKMREYDHWAMWWPDFLLRLSVCMYWAARFQVRTWGLDDFGVAIKELTPTEATVSGMVLAYLYISGEIKRYSQRKAADEILKGRNG